VETARRPGSEGEYSNIVIVGGGAAALAAAEELRERNYEGALTIIGEERGEPYDRPPLSKQVLAGTWEPERATLYSQSRIHDLEATILSGVKANAIDSREHTISADFDREVHFDAAILATGVRPRTLPINQVRGVQVLRTMEDALMLQKRLRRDAHLLVVGAGFLGLEVAATAKSMGCTVTVVEPMLHPLSDRLGDLAASRLLQLHRDNGVTILVGVSVQSIAEATHAGNNQFERDAESSESVGIVLLSDGRSLAADTVIVAIGCSPNTEWIGDTAINLDDGIVCDQYCCATADVWAAGDVARWTHRGLGRSLRIEHRMNATEHGRAAARNLLGAREPYVPTPFFWTDHFTTKVHVMGIIPSDAEMKTVHGDIHGDSFVVLFQSEGRSVGALSWNAPRFLMPLRAEIDPFFKSQNEDVQQPIS
jgi:3-phenylpropionate/trans-cinnamate dioxygenase ferredoxin reductase subunit